MVAVAQLGGWAWLWLQERWGSLVSAGASLVSISLSKVNCEKIDQMHMATPV